MTAPRNLSAASARVARWLVVLSVAFALGGCSHAQPTVSHTTRPSKPATLSTSAATSATLDARVGIDDTPAHVARAYFRAMSRGKGSEANSYLSRANEWKNKPDYYASDYLGCSITDIEGSDGPVDISGRPDYRLVFDVREVAIQVRYKHHSLAGDTGDVSYVVMVARDTPGGPWRIVEIGTA